MCSPPAERPARPAAECFQAADSQRYVGQLGTLIGETLSGWRSHPGTAELSAIFGDDGRVASLCFDSVSGPAVARRVPDVAIRARELPAGPACFAGRRLDFAWESEIATWQELRQVARGCRREINAVTRHIDWCRVGRHCSLNLVLSLIECMDRHGWRPASRGVAGATPSGAPGSARSANHVAEHAGEVAGAAR